MAGKATSRTWRNTFAKAIPLPVSSASGEALSAKGGSSKGSSLSKVDIASPGTNPGIFHDRRYISSQVVGRLAEGFTVAQADAQAKRRVGRLQSVVHLSPSCPSERGHGRR